jgi:hypothetical protein
MMRGRGWDGGADPWADPHKRLLNDCVYIVSFGMLLAYEGAFGDA